MGKECEGWCVVSGLASGAACFTQDPTLGQGRSQEDRRQMIRHCQS